MNKIVAYNKLKELLIKYESNRDDILNPKINFNEDETRSEYIDVFLEIFGWDVQNKLGLNFSLKEVNLEHYLNANNKPDYSLRRNGETVLTIEAEKPRKDITKDRQPAHQVLRYGYFANNDIGVLFNMERIEIYQTVDLPTPFDKKKPGLVKAPYFFANYTEYMDRFDELWTYLSHDSIYGTEFDAKVAKITPEKAQKTKLDAAFLSEINEWRVWIGQDLFNADKKYSDRKKLNDDVQTFLNQVIFLRFAEDNSLEKSRIVEGTFNSGKSFQEHLNKLDKKYNSGIFVNSQIATFLQKETINKITKRLYYPQVNYDFSLIDVTLLGHVYEQFLQKTLSVDDNGFVILQKTKSAAIKSIVSTPIETTRKIVELALAERLERIGTLKELLQLKIADIAVGSGIFLIVAYDLIEGRAVDILAKEKDVTPRLSLADFDFKRKLISTVFTGVDIDYHAIEITKFSLALRLLRGESSSRTQGLFPLIPNLSEHMFSSNSLIESEDVQELINTTASNSELFSTVTDQLTDINPSEDEIGNFDIIIGNPPYLSTEQMKQESQVEFDLYKKKFISAYKQFDKYFLFIETATRRLKTDGVLVYILPNKFTKIQSGKKLRDYLEDRKLINSFIDFGETQMFKGKSTYVAIVTFSNNNTHVNFQRVHALSEINKQKFKRIPYNELTIGDGPWIFNDDPKVLNLFQKLQGSKKITDVTNVVNGIQTSSRLYLFNKSELTVDNGKTMLFTHKKSGDQSEIEKELLKPLFKNQNKKQKKYANVVNDYYVIFPYKDGKLIPENTLKELYPKGFKYLQKHRAKLLPKSMNGERDVPNAVEFYQYGRTQALSLDWSLEKIIITVLSKEPSAAYNDDGSLLASGGTAGYVPIFSKGKDYDLKYILGWLNQPIVDKMFTLISTVFEGGYWAHGTSQLKMIPILEIDHSNTMEEELYENIISTVDTRVHSNNEKMNSMLEKKIQILFSKLIQLKTGLKI